MSGVNVYNGNSHLLAVVLQLLQEIVLSCAVGFAYASFYKIAVNCMPETAFGHTYENCGCRFLCTLFLFQEYCYRNREACEANRFQIGAALAEMHV